MKLITELSEEVEIIREGAGDSKKLYITGPFIQTEKVNRNGRVYKKDRMLNEVNRYIEENVKKNKAWGELGHPDGVKINEDRISHRIVELVENGNDWIGKAIITNTPMGKIVEGLMESGGYIGISTRGTGSLRMNSNGINEVQSDYRIATGGDIVLDPSGPDCWVNGIMEGVEYLWDDRTGSLKVTESAEKAKREIESIYSKRTIDEKRLFEAFNDYLKRL